MERFWDRFNPFTHLRKTQRSDGICSTDKFRTLLERERCRADRTGQEFSLVLFNVENGNENDILFQHLEGVLVRRIRFTDEVGRFDERNIGVVLPATSAEGAWKFANDISSRVTPPLSHLDCKVYTYPTRGLPHEGEYREQLRFPGFFRNLDRATFREPSVNKNLATNKYIASVAFLSATHSQVSMRQVEKLESLIARQFPVWKRVIDIIGASIGLIAFSPVMFVVAAAIKLTSRGPVIFKQQRVGLGGEKFIFFKFRSMYVNNDTVTHEKYVEDFIAGEKDSITEKELAADDGIYKIRSDPRVTPVGKFLRKSSLDELPQFLNVLKGDMSLVGPRPPIPYEYERYDNWHKRRALEAKPGITGLWQVKGRSSTTFKEMVRLDLKYIREWSLSLDFKILLQTPRAVLSGKGAY